MKRPRKGEATQKTRLYKKITDQGTEKPTSGSIIYMDNETTPRLMTGEVLKE